LKLEYSFSPQFLTGTKARSTCFKSFSTGIKNAPTGLKSSPTCIIRKKSLIRGWFSGHWSSFLFFSRTDKAKLL
jgi:hypothetical protein